MTNVNIVEIVPIRIIIAGIKDTKSLQTQMIYVKKYFD